PENDSVDDDRCVCAKDDAVKGRPKGLRYRSQAGGPVQHGGWHLAVRRRRFPRSGFCCVWGFNTGSAALPPSREATADRRSLGGGGQGCLYSRGFVARQTLDVFRRRFVRAHAFIDVRGDCLEVEARGAKKISSTR